MSERGLSTLLLLSELVGYFNAIATEDHPNQAVLEDFAERCSYLLNTLLDEMKSES